MTKKNNFLKAGCVVLIVFLFFASIMTWGSVAYNNALAYTSCTFIAFHCQVVGAPGNFVPKPGSTLQFLYTNVNTSESMMGYYTLTPENTCSNDPCCNQKFARQSSFYCLPDSVNASVIDDWSSINRGPSGAVYLAPIIIGSVGSFIFLFVLIFLVVAIVDNWARFN